MPSKPSALFLCPESPYPVQGGGPLRSASLITYLEDSYDLDVFTCYQPGEPNPLRHFPEGRLRHIYTHRLPVHSSRMAARAWRNLNRLRRSSPPLLDRFLQIRIGLEPWLEDREYDLCIFEHFWCAPQAEILRSRCRRLVLDLHNIESNWHDRCAEFEMGPVRWAHQRFAEQYRYLEQEWLPYFDDVITTSHEDAELIRQAHGASVRLRVYPNAIPSHELPNLEREEVIAFSGNFAYLPNRQAVRYFRERIWPRIRVEFPNVRWRLIGRSPEYVADLVKGDRRIEVTGPVVDAIDELARARVAVVPLLSGSGTRLKVLEAWAAATPVVSTPIGVEGICGENGKHWLLAETPEEFCSVIRYLWDSPLLTKELGTAGRVQFNKHYTWGAAWKTLEWLG